MIQAGCGSSWKNWYQPQTAAAAATISSRQIAVIQHRQQRARQSVGLMIGSVQKVFRYSTRASLSAAGSSVP